MKLVQVAGWLGSGKTTLVIALGEPGDVTVDGRDGDPANHFKLVINSVVYGLSGEAVKQATESALKNLISKFRFLREP